MSLKPFTSALTALFLLTSLLADSASGEPESFETAWKEAVSAYTRPPIGRVFSDEKVNEEATSVEKIEGTKHFKVPILKVQYKSAAKLTEMVMKDNTVGNIHPGALLWSGELAEGRITPLPALPDRPRVRAALSGVSVARNGEAATPSFEFDGLFSDFQKNLNDRSLLIKNVSPKTAMSMQTGNSSEAAMLKVGLSLSGWGAKLRWDMDSNSSQTESFAIVALDEVYYSASCDAPAINAMVPITAIAKNPDLAEQMLKMIRAKNPVTGKMVNGEPAYVRSVDYGRRVYISIRATAAADDLSHAIDASYHGYVDADANVALKNKQIQNSFQVHVEVIGGGDKAREELMALFDHDKENFFANVDKYLRKSASLDGAIGVPVSFQVAYVSDNSPMQTYETADYSGNVPLGAQLQMGETLRIPGYGDPTVRKVKFVESPLKMTGKGVTGEAGNATLEAGNGDVNADGHTGVTVKYNIHISKDLRWVVLSLTMSVRQLDHRDKYPTNWTHILTRKDFRIFELGDDDRRTIRAVDGIDMVGDSGERVYREHFGRLQQFPPHSEGDLDVGGLSEIQLQFDGPGGDIEHQDFQAKLGAFKVVINDEGVTGNSTLTAASTPGSDLLWFKHLDAAKGLTKWVDDYGRKVGTGWEGFMTVAAAPDGVLYAVDTKGQLLWFKHLDTANGSMKWADDYGKYVGTGWGGVKTIMAAADGVLYAIDANGDLLWNKHLGAAKGDSKWSDGNSKKIGTGWGGFKTVVAAPDGVLYAVDTNGDLLWFKHLDTANGSTKWADDQGKKIGGGWGGFKTVMAAADGVLYAIDANGDLLWFKHLDAAKGSAKWFDDYGKKIGTGWGGFIAVIAAPDGVFYAR